MHDETWWKERPLLRRIWITKAARFAAHRRLLKKKSLNLYLNTMLSVFLIGVSLATSMIPEIFGPSALKLLASYTIFASVLSIVLTLIDEKEAAESKAEQLHACARELTEVFNKYSDSFLESDSSKKATELEYQRSIDRCPINHDDIDFKTVKIKSSELFNDTQNKFTYYFSYFLMMYGKFLSIILINATIFYIMLSIN